VWANKGEALDRFLTVYQKPDFLFAAGDDRTDEDLFEHIQDHAWTVHVGRGPTRAAFVVPDIVTLRRVLEALSSQRV
jgi:trehalose-6-phosphatase